MVIFLIFYDSDTPFQSVSPVRDGEAEILPDFRLVEHAVGRTHGTGGVCRTFDGAHGAGKVRFFHDGHGEIVPAGHALVAEVIHFLHAGPDLRQHGDNGRGKIRRIGGGTRLIEHHAEALAFRAQAAHGLHEICPEGGVEPRGADDDGTFGPGKHGVFPGKLGSAVYGNRIRGILFRIGAAGGAVEHIIRGNLYDAAAVARKVQGAERVHLLRRLCVVLGLVHRRVGRAVDDEIEAVSGKKGLHRLFIRDVEFPVPDIHGLFAQKKPQFTAELAAGSGN